MVWQYIPELRIEAYYWHLRHGTSLTIDGYRVPVPKHWYVHYVLPNDVMLIDLNSGDSITVRTSSQPKGLTLATWEALISRPLLGGAMKVLGRKQLQAGGETIVCIERNIETEAVHLYPIECRSESALEVTFRPYVSSKKSTDMFYSLLQQLQKL